MFSIADRTGSLGRQRLVVPLVDGVAGALLLLNDEAHNTTSPQARVDVHRRSIDWFQDVGPELKRSVHSWFG